MDQAEADALCTRPQPDLPRAEMRAPDGTFVSDREIADQKRQALREYYEEEILFPALALGGSSEPVRPLGARMGQRFLRAASQRRPPEPGAPLPRAEAKASPAAPPTVGCPSCEGRAASEGSTTPEGPYTPVYPHDYGPQGTRLTPLAADRHVFTKRDLVHHIEAHRERIWILSQEIVKQNPERYGAVDLDEVRSLAFKHDEMKVTGDRTLLRELGFGGDASTGRRPRTVAGHLVDLWGKRVSSESGLDPEAGAVMVKMNKGDKQFEAAYSPETQEIVSLADKIDKGMDPLTKFEELGRVAIKPSQYLSNPSNSYAYNPEMARMAEGVEERYYEIIPERFESLAYRRMARERDAAKRLAVKCASCDGDAAGNAGGPFPSADARAALERGDVWGDSRAASALRNSPPPPPESGVRLRDGADVSEGGERR